MKAAQINSYGGSEVIKVQDAPKPTLKEGHIIVAVRASSINPSDLKILSGAWQAFAPLSFPATLGGDFAGIVEEVASDVTNFRIGDEVYGQANAIGDGSGTFAEFTLASAGRVALKPDNITFEAAASLPLVGVSALQALTENIDLKKGQKILISGGAGGIGNIAIQIAKDIGAYVATTVSSNEISYAKELGADEVIDYTTEDFTTQLTGYDAIFDTVGNEKYQKAFNILKKNAVIVSMQKINSEESNGVKLISQQTNVSTNRLEELTTLVEKGAVQPQIGKIFKLEETAMAFDNKKTGHIRGKIVIRV